MKNNNLILIIFTIVLGLLITAPVYAIDDVLVQGDDTIMVLEEDDTPDVIDNIIVLPDHAPERAVTRSQHGRETASEARERGRAFGQERALEARESNMSEQAKEAREKARIAGDEKAQVARDRRMDEQARERVENENRGRKNEVVKPEHSNPAGK